MINLTHSCLLTEDVKRMKEFYIDLLGVNPQVDNQGYVEFHLGDSTILAIFDISVHNTMAMEAARPQSNHSIILEFRVEDAGDEYERVKKMNVEIIKSLTTQAWGNTSFWFKDPDGNFLNFYSRK